MTAQTVAIDSPLRQVSPRIAMLILNTAMFFTGASGLVAEYVLGTVSTYILGNGIEQMSMTIATMLLMMGVGGWAQRFIPDNDLLIEKFLVLEALLAILIGFAPIAIYSAFGLMESHFALVQYFFIMGIGLLIGFEIPLVIRINSHYTQLRLNLSSVIGLDYIGSFVGALVWVYYLLKYVPLHHVGFYVAGLNFSVAIIALCYFLWHGKVKHRLRTVAILTAALAALIYGYTQSNAWGEQLEQRLYNDPIVFSETTRYQHLVLTHAKTLDEYRLYINGNLQFSSVDEAIYHEQLVHPALSMTHDRRRVLILGGGDGLALREVLKYPDVEHVTLVDLDPEMIRIATENSVLAELNDGSLQDARVSALVPNSVVSSGLTRTVLQETGETEAGKPKLERVARVDVYTVDADRFLEGVSGAWNVIIIDFPDPTSVELAKLYSKEFYQKLARKLSERGMLAIQSTSPYHAKEAYLCIRRTMEAAGFGTLPYHDNVPSFGDWGWFLAWKPVSRSKGAVEARMDSLVFPVETHYLTPEVFRRSLTFGKGWLESESDAVNTLMNPVLVQLYVDQGWQID